MRLQFFLDARDYVKYSLLDDLMAQLGLRQLTLIWMLTPDTGNNHGSRRPKFDEARAELNAFFTEMPRPDLSDVRRHFMGRGYRCNSYGDRPDSYLTRGSRIEYFREIPDETLRNALVFLDPDNGIEPRSGATTAHVRLEELKLLWERMGAESVLVVYQHKPRVRSEEFWPNTVARVIGATNGQVDALLFGDVGFVIAARAGLHEFLHERPSFGQWASHLKMLERGL